MPLQPRISDSPQHIPSAVVYCDANFRALNGKTANGLARQSEQDRMLAIIDGVTAGVAAGVVLGDPLKSIPVCRDVADVLAHLGSTPDYF